jgi:hypothetical protein
MCTTWSSPKLLLLLLKIFYLPMAVKGFAPIWKTENKQVKLSPYLVLFIYRGKVSNETVRMRQRHSWKKGFALFLHGRKIKESA